MARQVYALAKGGSVYTVLAMRRDSEVDRDLMRVGYRYYGYCDAERCGIFRSKKEFERMVDMLPESVPFVKEDRCQAAYTAEMWGRFEALSILGKLAERLKQQKEQAK